MRAHFIAAAVIALASTSAQAAEADLFGQVAAMSAEDLQAKRGGTETADWSSSVLQGNESMAAGTNSGNISLGGGAKYSGTIAPAQVNGNNGITAVMQNTGDLVNMNNITSVNVYTR
ncbi:MAG: hypothetical protein NVV74_21865 [Magnetospirillum sp.]|nr:hypothetical protein [Magnetospirillum sp.]